jgi:hypothetical protein
VSDTWFDKLLVLLQRMDTPRLLLLRDLVVALAARREAEVEASESFSSIEAAVLGVAERD